LLLKRIEIHLLAEEQKRKLEELSNTDPLTGVHNRRYFMQAAAAQITRVVRQKNEAYIVMLDLDHFKNVNDKYGHSAGDDVIKEAAAATAGMLRPYDLIARYGGEEFIMFIAEIDRPGVIQLAERIRTAISDTQIEAEGGCISVTASIGVASVEPGRRLEDTIELADKALYQAKEEGRNRVIIFD
jgi:diguanylate cyclase (GGDEF)-like protein